MTDTKTVLTMDAFLAKHGKKPVSYQTLNDAVDAVQAATIEALKRQKAAIAALESRIKELEARPPGVEYGGVYENAKAYPRGVLISRGGGLWLSLRDDNGWAPGQSPQHWKLVVKSREAE